MFARISGSIAGDWVDATSVQDACPANAWIWSEQTIAAQRRRLGCPPFQSPNSRSQQGQQHRASLVCRASGRRQKQPQAPLWRPHKYRVSSRGTRHSPLSSLPASNGRSSSGILHSSSIPQLQQQQQAPVDPQQLSSCIDAATHYHQLEALCNTFLHNPAFTGKHAALVISRLHKVASRPRDSQLLLVELLAAKLRNSSSCSTTSSSSSPGCGSSRGQQEQQLSPREVAAVCWGFARVGYQADAGLMQQLLEQFWSCPDAQPQHQQQQQQQGLDPKQQQCQHQVGCIDGPALAHLVAGLAGLGVRDPLVWARVRAAVQQVLPDLTAPSLQQLLWGLATAQQSDAAAVDALAAAVSVQMDAGSFDAEGLAQVVWCLHVLGHDSSSDLYARASQLMMHKVGATTSSSGSRSAAAATAAKAQAGQLVTSRHGGGAADAGSIAPAPVQHAQEEQVRQATTQQQQQVPKQQLQQLQRPQPPPTLQQAAPQLQQIALRLPSNCHHQQQQQSQVPKLLEQTAAALRSAAASQVSSAYAVLQKYDPLLCTLALHRDYFQPAHC